MLKINLTQLPAFLKWLAKAEQLPTPASDSESAVTGRKQSFLKELISRESLPVLDPLPATLPDRPGFIRHLLSREALPSLSGKGPDVTENRRSQTPPHEEPE